MICYDMYSLRQPHTPSNHITSFQYIPHSLSLSLSLTLSLYLCLSLSLLFLFFLSQNVDMSNVMSTTTPVVLKLNSNPTTTNCQNYGPWSQTNREKLLIKKRGLKNYRYSKLIVENTASRLIITHPLP